MLLSNAAVVIIKAVSSTKRLPHSGRRVSIYYYWQVSLDKADALKIGWWRSAPEDIFFITTPHVSGKFCDLKKYTGGIPISKQIHKLSYEAGNKIRLRPYLGPKVRWDPMSRSDPDTLIEYFPETDTVRIHYPTGLRPYQGSFYKGTPTITKILTSELG